MSDEHVTTDRDAWNDRLVEQGLEEVVGGVRPPDLRAQILSEAKGAGELTAPTSTLAEPTIKRRPRGYAWRAMAVAACLLVATLGLLLPRVESERTTARRTSTDVATQTRGATPSNASGPRPAQPGESPEVVAQAAEGQDDAAIDLMMMVTPHVVVEEEAPAEARLSLGVGVNSDAAAPSDRAGDGLEAAPGQAVSELGDLAPAATTAPNSTTVLDLGVPFRPGTFGADSADQAALPALSAPVELLTTVAPQSGPNQPLLVDGMDHYYENARRVAQQQAGVSVSESLAYHDARSTRSRGLGEAYRWYEPRTERFSLGFHRGLGGDQYAPIIENAFLPVSAANTDNRLSTFSIDVDTASYANVRQFLLQGNQLPPPDAVRIEELINYFDYDYAGPAGDVPFASNVEVAACPWAPQHRLVRIGLKGREAPQDQRPKSNLVFLVDVSGSMDEPNKLPLVVEGLRLLTKELGENDRIAIVVYASTEGLVLESTRGDQQKTILGALRRLQAGGSTAGGAGIQLAYSVAAQNFVTGGVNRVILCTDGDFNVGVTDVEELQAMAAQKAKDTGVFLTVLGFGRGNLNDELMEAIADRGNGNYHYVDSRSEARKVLVEQMTGTLVTIAKDVKLQVEFNPAKVAAYRLIGYENRVLAAQDFNDDTKDAGEIGAGHTVTALYEVVPVGVPVEAGGVDELKYAAPAEPVAAAARPEAEAEASTPMTDELLTLKIRCKQPDGDESTKLEFPVTDAGQSFAKASADFQFASAVASFGMLLRGSKHAGDATLAGVLEIAESASGTEDPRGYRREFAEMVSRAKQLSQP